MIISPPFLPGHGNQNETQWLDDALQRAETGLFPVSHKLGWHGGRHLIAPADGNGLQSVRAIADGTVLFTRSRTDTNDHAHPLWYDGGYTSDAVVVIEHVTEIGADADNQPVTVKFYSVYVHLDALAPGVQKGKTIYRKDVIGQAGHIAGAPGRIHFEICVDDDNLRKLVGRATGELDVTSDGRTDVLYGDVYFRLPAGTKVYADRPDIGSPAVADAAVLTTADEDWFIGLHHEKGSAHLATYDQHGGVIGERTESDAEYALHAHAHALSLAVDKVMQQKPSPTACYELLRFGRALGPDSLNPANTPHWRQIATRAGIGWVNLNAPEVRKFSDADFPHWRGWTLIDDSANRDSRCDSPRIKRLLDVNGDGRVTLEEAEAQLRQDSVRQQLAKAICRMSSEWDKSGIDARWHWLKTVCDEQPVAMSEQDYADFNAYAEALCFDCAPLFAAQWRIEPGEFIRHLRQCAWRSEKEFVQLVPSHAVRTAQKNKAMVVLWEPVNVNIGNAIFTNHRIPLNKMMRKYGIDTPLRQAAFFGNAIQETGWFGGLAESGGSRLWYAPWYGRGFLQLTNPVNYCDYWRWRGRVIPPSLYDSLKSAYQKTAGTKTTPRTNALLNDQNFQELTPEMIGWRNNVQADPDPRQPEEKFSPSDSAGFYWASLCMARYADEMHAVERCAVPTDQGQKVYYRSQAFWRASAAVNLPGATGHANYRGINGFDSRCCAYGVALAVLTEMRLPDASGSTKLDYPEGFMRRKI